MKLDLHTTLGTFENQRKVDTARYHLMARCGHCDHRRRVEASKLIESFGEEAQFHLIEDNLVCPICGKPAKQYLTVYIVE